MEASARDWEVGESELRVPSLKVAYILTGANIQVQVGEAIPF